MSSLRHVSDLLNSYSNRKVTLVTSIAIEDEILESVSDLIDEGYRLWFISRLKAVGKAKFLEAADKARKYGKDQKRLFPYLLRK